MSSMNQRFRNLVGSKRKPTSNGLTTSNSNNSLNTSPNLSQTNGNTPPLGSSSDRNSTQSQPPSSSLTAQQAGASTTSLAMNPNHQPQQPLGRPPSYQYANQGANNNLGAPAPHPQAGRPTSPLPPPINTATNHYAHLPPHQQQMYAQQPPPQAGPPGYPPQQQQPQQQQQQYGYAPQAMTGGQPAYGGRPYTAVDTNQQRSKAQLIVGIDFVRLPAFDESSRHQSH